MATPLSRFRSSAPLAIGASTAGASMVALGAFTYNSYPFASSLFLMLAGVAFGLAVIPLVYDRYQRDRRRHLWRRVRREVLRTFAGRLYLFTLTLRWHLNIDQYRGHGTMVDTADVDPDAAAVAAHSACIADVLAFHALFKDHFDTPVSPYEGAEESVTGEHLVNALRVLFTPDLRHSLRIELMSLGPVAEDSGDLTIALEELLSTAMWALEYGRGAVAGELGDTTFLRLFRQLALQLKSLYARIADEWQAA